MPIHWAIRHQPLYKLCPGLWDTEVHGLLRRVDHNQRSQSTLTLTMRRHPYPPLLREDELCSELQRTRSVQVESLSTSCDLRPHPTASITFGPRSGECLESSQSSISSIRSFEYFVDINTPYIHSMHSRPGSFDESLEVILVALLPGQAQRHSSQVPRLRADIIRERKQQSVQMMHSQETKSVPQ